MKKIPCCLRAKFTRVSNVLLCLVLSSCQTSNFNSSHTTHTYQQNTKKPPAESKPVWSFSVENNECYASVSTNSEKLSIYSENNYFINFYISGSAIRSVITHGKPPAHLIFAGPSGSWKLSIQSQSADSLSTKLPSNETTASEVLAILAGGVLQSELAHGAVHTLHVPDSNIAGREWFSCIRSKINS
jgi:hypothetical protein